MNVVFLVFDQFDLMDLSVAIDVLTTNTVESRRPLINLKICSIEAPIAQSKGHVQVKSNCEKKWVLEHANSIFLVGSQDRTVVDRLVHNEFLKTLFRDTYQFVHWGSLGIATEVLAKIGCLDGFEVAPHWACSKEMGRQFPKLTVNQESIFVRDKNLWTSSGGKGTHEMFLALYSDLIKHHKPEPQEIPTPLTFEHLDVVDQATLSKGVRRVIEYIDKHYLAIDNVDDVVDLSAMSKRTLYRKFSEEIGTTPAKYVGNLRLIHFKNMLDNGVPPKQAAKQSKIIFSSQLIQSFVNMFGDSGLEKVRECI